MLGELDGIVDQVQKDLGDGPSVSPQTESAVWNDDSKIQTFLDGRGAQGAHYFLGYRTAIYVLNGKLHLPSLDLGDIQNVIDQRQEMLPPAFDGSDLLLLFL